MPPTTVSVRTVALAYLSAMLAAACSTVTPTRLTTADLASQNRQDIATAQRDVEPITGAVTLEEAVARALKYNLEQRSKMMEEAVALKQYDLSRYDMLPRLLAQAGYVNRDKDVLYRSTDSVTGLPSQSNPAISSDRERTTYDLGLTWSLLDFGLGYFNARQNADRLLIASERRRKAMHLLIQDVISAFWRTAGAQKLSAQVETTTISAEAALGDARRAESEGLRSPLDSLKYQRQLLQNLKQLEDVQQELASARIELAHLMNVPFAIDLKVVEPPETLATRIMTLPVEQLEEVALAQNADLREQHYNTRIASLESRKVILRLFPNLSFNYGWKYDSNSYLIHKEWRELGLQLSFNLFNLLSIPSQLQLAGAGVALTDQRRVATQLAVLAQLHIARLNYTNAIRQFSRADALWAVEDRLDRHSKNRQDAQAQGRLEAIANSTSAILSQLRRYQALSQVHAASGKLQASLGMEPEIDSVQDTGLTELTGAVRHMFNDWQAGRLPAVLSTKAGG